MIGFRRNAVGEPPKKINDGVAMSRAEPVIRAGVRCRFLYLLR